MIFFLFLNSIYFYENIKKIGKAGHKYGALFKCRYSRYHEGGPLFAKDAVEVATLFHNSVLLRYGGIARVHSDNGGEFLNLFMHEM